MDWTKAKNILIITLLITNLLLLSFYLVEREKTSRSEEEVLQETLTLLESKNIYVETALPEKHGKMAVLHVEYDHLDPAALKRALAEQTALPVSERTEENILSLCKGFLEGLGVWTETVTQDAVVQDGNATVVSYKNVYDGIDVEDSYIICVVRNGVVDTLERFWLDPMGLGKTRKETLSASAALIDFMSGRQLEGEIYIEEMELVYWLDPSAISTDAPVSDTAFPAWRITYNGGEVSYVTAYEE